MFLNVTKIRGPFQGHSFISCDNSLESQSQKAAFNNNANAAVSLETATAGSQRISRDPYQRPSTSGEESNEQRRNSLKEHLDEVGCDQISWPDLAEFVQNPVIKSGHSTWTRSRIWGRNWSSWWRPSRNESRRTKRPRPKPRRNQRFVK